MAYDFTRPVEQDDIDAKEMREILTCIFTLNYTESETSPSVTRNGLPRINAANPLNKKFQVFLDGSWRTLLENIQSGTIPTIRKEMSFSSSLVWTWDHNFGRKPIVHALDSSGNVIFADMFHATDNRVIVTHSVAIAGLLIGIG